MQLPTAFKMNHYDRLEELSSEHLRNSKIKIVEVCGTNQYVSKVSLLLELKESSDFSIQNNFNGDLSQLGFDS